MTPAGVERNLSHMTERGFGDSPEGGPMNGEDAAPPPRPAELAQPFDFHSVLQIADTLPVMVAYCDKDQVYRFCNQPIADWFERPRRDILGRTVAEVMGKKPTRFGRHAIEAAIGGARQFYAADFEHPTRGLLTTQAEYIPQYASDGSVAGVTMIVQDITEQRAAERAIKESEARFRRIANSAPAPMWVTRSDGSRDFVNQAYLDYFGFPPDEVGQHDWKRALHPDDAERIEREYVEGMAGGVAFELEARFLRADGEWRWLRSTSRPRIDQDGRVIGFVGVAADVTVSKNAESDLRRQIDERTAALEAAQTSFGKARRWKRSAS